ncbi:hypothetical protein ACWEJQ_22480 [Streptomyces albidoflavus]
MRGTHRPTWRGSVPQSSTADGPFADGRPVLPRFCSSQHAA